MGTSLSDNGQYPEFCYLASRHEEIFQSFKRNPTYNAILEHLNAEQGAAYLEIILNDYNFRLADEQLENILLNDSLGNPRRFTYRIRQQNFDLLSDNSPLHKSFHGHNFTL